MTRVAVVGSSAALALSASAMRSASAPFAHESPTMNSTLRALLPLSAFLSASPNYVDLYNAMMARRKVANLGPLRMRYQTPRAYRGGYTKSVHAQPWPRAASDSAAVSAAIAKRDRKNAARLAHFARSAG